jgi:hypothetical protein
MNEKIGGSLRPKIIFAGAHYGVGEFPDHNHEDSWEVVYLWQGKVAECQESELIPIQPGTFVETHQIAAIHESDAAMLNLVAWKIVEPHSHIPDRDWWLAVFLSRQATQIAPTVAGYHDTLAWALYGAKQTRKAIRSERLALRYREDEDELQKCQAALSLLTKFRR